MCNRFYLFPILCRGQTSLTRASNLVVKTKNLYQLVKFKVLALDSLRLVLQARTYSKANYVACQQKQSNFLSVVGLSSISLLSRNSFHLLSTSSWHFSFMPSFCNFFMSSQLFSFFAFSVEFYFYASQHQLTVCTGECSAVPHTVSPVHLSYATTDPDSSQYLLAIAMSSIPKFPWIVWIVCLCNCDDEII